MFKETKIAKKESKWAEKKTLLERNQIIKDDRQSFRKKRFTTTKFIIAFLFINCTAIEIFTGWVTYKSIQMAMMFGGYADFSPLITLIGTVVGEAIGFAVYALKAKAENQEGGITYLNAQHEYKVEDEEKYHEWELEKQMNDENMNDGVG